LEVSRRHHEKGRQQPPPRVGLDLTKGYPRGLHSQACMHFCFVGTQGGDLMKHCQRPQGGLKEVTERSRPQSVVGDWMPKMTERRLAQDHLHVIAAD
jgi:hypothetical protein